MRITQQVAFALLKPTFIQLRDDPLLIVFIVFAQMYAYYMFDKMTGTILMFLCKKV